MKKFSGYSLLKPPPGVRIVYLNFLRLRVAPVKRVQFSQKSSFSK